MTLFGVILDHIFPAFPRIRTKYGEINLAEKAVLHFLLIMQDCIKSVLQKKQLITSNAEHLKEKSSKY